MRKVKVYNDNQNVKVWKETFKGLDVEIEYGKPIEMDFYEAHEFRGQYFPIKKLADETQDPKTMKMIRVESVDLNELHEDIKKTAGYKCNACNKNYPSALMLFKHSEVEHAEQMVEDPELDHEIEIEKKAKRGRPAKISAEATE